MFFHAYLLSRDQLTKKQLELALTKSSSPIPYLLAQQFFYLSKSAIKKGLNNASLATKLNFAYHVLTNEKMPNQALSFDEAYEIGVNHPHPRVRNIFLRFLKAPEYFKREQLIKHKKSLSAIQALISREDADWSFFEEVIKINQDIKTLRGIVFQCAQKEIEIPATHHPIFFNTKDEETINWLLLTKNAPHNFSKEELEWVIAQPENLTDNSRFSRVNGLYRGNKILAFRVLEQQSDFETAYRYKKSKDSKSRFCLLDRFKDQLSIKDLKDYLNDTLPSIRYQALQEKNLRQPDAQDFYPFLRDEDDMVSSEIWSNLDQKKFAWKIGNPPKIKDPNTLYLKPQDVWSIIDHRPVSLETELTKRPNYLNQALDERAQITHRFHLLSKKKDPENQHDKNWNALRFKKLDLLTKNGVLSLEEYKTRIGEKNNWGDLLFLSSQPHAMSEPQIDDLIFATPKKVSHEYHQAFLNLPSTQNLNPRQTKGLLKKSHQISGLLNEIVKIEGFGLNPSIMKKIKEIESTSLTYQFLKYRKDFKWNHQEIEDLIEKTIEKLKVKDGLRQAKRMSAPLPFMANTNTAGFGMSPHGKGVLTEITDLLVDQPSWQPTLKRLNQLNRLEIISPDLYETKKNQVEGLKLKKKFSQTPKVKKVQASPGKPHQTFL